MLFGFPTGSLRQYIVRKCAQQGYIINIGDIVVGDFTRLFGRHKVGNAFWLGSYAEGLGKGGDGYRRLGAVVGVT